MQINLQIEKEMYICNVKQKQIVMSAVQYTYFLDNELLFGEEFINGGANVITLTAFAEGKEIKKVAFFNKGNEIDEECNALGMFCAGLGFNGYRSECSIDIVNKVVAKAAELNAFKMIVKPE